MLKTMLVFLLSFVICSTYADTPQPPQRVVLINESNAPIYIKPTINPDVVPALENGLTLAPNESTTITVFHFTERAEGYFHADSLAQTNNNSSSEPSLFFGIEFIKNNSGYYISVNNYDNDGLIVQQDGVKQYFCTQQEYKLRGERCH